MRKHYVKVMAMVLSAVMLMAMLSGCGSSASEPASLSEIDPLKYVTLGEYKGLTVSAADATVSEGEVDENLQSTLTYYAESVPVEGRAAKLGDTVNIDYAGKIDGVAFEKGTAKGKDLKLGSGSFIAGFEDGVAGMEKGETKDLNLTFPEDYRDEEVAGKDVVFTVTVNSISEDEIPELTDEFVQSISDDCKTVDEYREYVETELKNQKESEAKATQQADLLEKAVNAATCDEEKIPEWLISQNAAEYRESLESFVAQYGLDLNTYFAQSGATEEEFNKQAMEYGKNIAKSQLVVLAIAKQEGLEVTDQEKEDYYVEYASKYGSDVETVKSIIPDDELTNYLLQQEVMDFLYDNAVIK